MQLNRLLLSIALLCCFVAHAQIDTTICLDAPGSATKDYRSLAHYLCDGQQGDKAKANAIYNWITHNIKYDIDALKSFPTKIVPHDEKAAKTLKDRKGVCEGYALLFTEMCREVGLKAVSIDGYAKDWMFDNGDKVYIPRHAWCGVLINGRWELADPTWGAGGSVQSPGWLRLQLYKLMRVKVMYAKRVRFEFHYDTSYFMQDPMVFRMKHLPSDPLWQLTDTVMPREYYEQGDSAMMCFNTICKRVNNTPELERISTLDEKQKIFEYAERAFAYNNRFPDVLAQKQIFRAMSELEKAFTDTTIETGLLLVKAAQNGLKESVGHIDAQKRSIPEEYSQLKKKNKAKSQVAKQEINKVKSDNKRMIADCKRYTNAANAKYTRARKKKIDAGKRKTDLNARKIAKVEPARMQKKSTSPEIKTFNDSLDSREARMAELQKQLDVQHEALKQRLAENQVLLDTLARCLALADSVIVQQTIARLRMKDSYDDDVILAARLFDELKYQRADTLLRRYLVGFDTITTQQDRYQKVAALILDLYKKNLRTLEQYRKWASYDDVVIALYNSCVKDYTEAFNKYNEEIVQMVNYLKGNKQLFAGLTKISKRQLKIAEYMEKAEHMRKDLEEKKIAEKQTFDNKETQKQKQVVQELVGKLQKITDKYN